MTTAAPGILSRAIRAEIIFAIFTNKRIPIVSRMKRRATLVAHVFDPETAVEVLSQLRHICTTDGITAVISLHQIDLARRFGDRVIAMRDGSVVADASVDELTDQMCASIYRSEASGRSSQQAHHHSSHSQPQPVAAMEAAL